MPRAKILIPKRSMTALANSLDASELTHDWQVETIGDTVIARRSGTTILTSLYWNSELECWSVDVRVFTRTGEAYIIPLEFAQLLPAYPNLHWDGKEGKWLGYDERAPGFDPLLVPIRGALVGHLARELAYVQLQLEHGLEPEDEQAQKYANAAMIVAGLYCAPDIDETPLQTGTK